MNILVTGGCGFIGSNLIKKLLLNKNYQIFNIDKLGYASNINSIAESLNLNNQERYKFYKVDLKNFHELCEIINLIKPDLVMHLAAESHVDRSINSPWEFIESNVIGTYNLLEASRSYFNKLNGTKIKLSISSYSTDEVFGSLSDIGTFSEKTPYDPRSPILLQKLQVII